MNRRNPLFVTQLHGLTAQVVRAPVGSPTVVTFYAGTAYGNIAATALTCSIPVGLTSCTDTTDTITLSPGEYYIAQIANGSTSATGQVVINAEMDQLQ